MKKSGMQGNRYKKEGMRENQHLILISAIQNDQKRPTGEFSCEGYTDGARDLSLDCTVHLSNLISIVDF